MSLADVEFNSEDELEEFIETKDAATVYHGQALLETLLDKGFILWVSHLCKLRESPKLQSVIKQIKRYNTKVRRSIDIIEPVEEDPEYRLIFEATNIAADIDNEIVTIHKFVKDIYQKRFPELDSLVVSPLEYVLTVKELGNNLDIANYEETLQQYLTQAAITVVSVTACRTRGTLLSDFQISQIDEGCDMAIELNNSKLKIYEYVERRLPFIAPNISTILGASTAAKIMVIAGGLTKLSKIPACDVLILGQQKRTLSGIAETIMLPNTGFIYHSEIVQNSPSYLRNVAALFVAEKAISAARVDASHDRFGGRTGKLLRKVIELRLTQLQEPPPVKFVKSLPKSVEAPRKKRGGKMAKKMKDCYAITKFMENTKEKANAKAILATRVDASHEKPDGRIGKMLCKKVEKKLDKLQESPPVKFVKPLPKPVGAPRKERDDAWASKIIERYAKFRKHANLMNNVDIEDDTNQGDFGYTRGIIGKSGTSRIRFPQVNEKTKVRISETSQKNLQKQQAWGGSTTAKKQVLVTASSVAFTPLQSLEIVNPQAAKIKVKKANEKAILAARVDTSHEKPDKQIGKMFREEVEKKLDKFQKPPPAKLVKLLPKPVEAPKKKRGSKSVRKMKERYDKFKKHINLMNLADIEDDAYQDGYGYARGTIGKSGTGRIRWPQVDEKTKVRILETPQKNLQKQQAWGGSTTVNKQVLVTASNIAFTPLQGLEIVNPPVAKTKVHETNAKYFTNITEFLQLEEK